MNMIDNAIHALSIKSYSEYELRQELEMRYGALPDLENAINQTMDYLKSHQIINDRHLARHLAQHYAHKGDRFIENILKQRKIKSEYINEALRSIPEERTRAWEESHKKLINNYKNEISEQEKINIISRFLSGRQFSTHVINETLSRLNKVDFIKLKPLTNWYQNNMAS
ncbi:regulatory protein RecX [Legionella bozemanae]|uniref:regulatory protein RecX n=1 Tax=Legionella bozemanae TaxID=447 RepID=UPI0010416A84|nr:RecX family transcriptional regulator [Legionella bozemanae]